MVRDKIVVMDDDISIIRLITDILHNENFYVYFVTDCEMIFRVVTNVQPALIILDIMLPEPGGFDVLRRIRESSTVSIIAMSDRKETKYKISCLEAGADDYLVKPFNNEEFMAQIRALLRRTGNTYQENNTSFTKRGLVIDYEKRIVTVEGKEIYLTATEYRLLNILAGNAEKTFEYNELVSAIWGQEYTDHVEYLHTFISQLRLKIEKDSRHPQYIQTIPRIGYRFHKNNI